MGKLSGTLLIFAGVCLAAYTLSTPHERTQRAAMVVTAPPAASPAPPAAPKAPAADAMPEPSAKPARDADMPPPRGGGASAALSSPSTTLAPASSTLRPPRPAEPTVVQMGEAPPRVPVGAQATAGPPLDRLALAREIQQQLKRIGCYRGAVSGVWGASVRQAMKVFTDRVNASLPTDQPDPILLAMVKSREPGTCSASCPAGQGRASDGRCLPDALVANAGKLRAPEASIRTDRPRASAGTRSTQTDMAARPSPLDGRMSLAGPSVNEPGRIRREGAPQAPRGRATYSYNPRPAPAFRSTRRRVRERYRAAQRPVFGFPGFSGWGLPFSLP